MPTPTAIRVNGQVYRLVEAAKPQRQLPEALVYKKQLLDLLHSLGVYEESTAFLPVSPRKSLESILIHFNNFVTKAGEGETAPEFADAPDQLRELALPVVDNLKNKLVDVADLIGRINTALPSLRGMEMRPVSPDAPAEPAPANTPVVAAKIRFRGAVYMLVTSDLYQDMLHKTVQEVVRKQPERAIREMDLHQLRDLYTTMIFRSARKTLTQLRSLFDLLHARVLNVQRPTDRIDPRIVTQMADWVMTLAEQIKVMAKVLDRVVMFENRFRDEAEVIKRRDDERLQRQVEEESSEIEEARGFAPRFPKEEQPSTTQTPA